MAHVFYFNSPHESAAAASAKYRSPFRRRAHVKRTKARSVNVDMFTTQRACVAQFREPAFCPSDASNLLLPGSLTTATSDLEMRCDMDDVLDDDEDDEAGGVALPAVDEDTIMMDDEDRLHGPSSTVHTLTDSATSDDTLPRQLFLHSEIPPIPSASNLNIPRPDHPRPETRDIGEEEDGRRLRLALEGDAPDEEPRFTFPAADDAHQAPAPTFDSHATSTPASATSRLASRRASAHDMLNQLQTHPNGSTVLGDISTQLETPWDQQNMVSPLDDDALAVDDPQRDYDFVDFMDLWRLRSIKDRRLPRFEPGPQPSVRLGRPNKPISRKDFASGAVDEQGIRWKVVGPRREDATKARELLHPSPVSESRERLYPPLNAVPGYSQLHERKEKHYRLRSFTPAHRAKCSHYQLRNVLGAASRNELFYATGTQVKRTSLACPNLQQTVMDLSKPQSSSAGFRVTCLSASPRELLNGSGIVIAGGFFGEYAIRNLDAIDATVTEGFVTHAYNGLVTQIHAYADRRSGFPQAVFCSNDRKVRVMDVGTMNFTSEFSYENAINCASTSPDGRLRVLVGDSHETLITNAETGQKLVTLRVHDDHGFACDWSRDGIHFATASQDGVVLIWDARNWSKPCKTWSTSMSCARSVQFTDTGALVVAENDDIVRVYDGARGHHYQKIDFFGSIAGVALIDGGEELVVANADKTVGGLLSYERTAQGFGECGSFGQEVGVKWARREERVSDFVVDLVV